MPLVRVDIPDSAEFTKALDAPEPTPYREYYGCPLFGTRPKLTLQHSSIAIQHQCSDQGHLVDIFFPRDFRDARHNSLRKKV
jgi:hypothetical protein